jgi:general secretion pathway protein B
MSYILDALRKADAQRDRQRVPGLHDQTGAPPPAAVVIPAVLLWGVVIAALVSLALAAWQLWPAGEPEPPQRVAEATPSAAPAMPAPVAPPAPAAAVQPAPPPPVQTAPPPVSAAPARAQPPATQPPAVQPPPAPPPAAVQAPQVAQQPTTADQRSARPAPAASAPVAAAARAASAPAPAQPAIGEAPADAPRIAVNGGVYSAEAAQRMLIVNGQVFNEGAEVAPGLVLEEIRPNQAVLRWRGQRYALRY